MTHTKKKKILQTVMFMILGGIAIPGAVFGVLLGGFLLKRFQLGPKGSLSHDARKPVFGVSDQV